LNAAAFVDMDFVGASGHSKADRFLLVQHLACDGRYLDGFTIP
jgi:hypothetical protein